MSLFKKNPVSTNRKTVFSKKRSNVEIVKMAKDYFNPNSAVLMPAGPGTSNSAEDVKKAALKREGILSLASVLSQLWGDARDRIIVAGMADDTDDKLDMAKRFAMGTARATNVNELLMCRKDAWAANCVANHLIDDYKRILKYVHLTMAWDCDPGTVNSTWDDATFQATNKFVLKYKALHVDPDKKKKKWYPENLARNLATTVKDDSNHKWPVELWKAVYDLYYFDLCRLLLRTPADIIKKRALNTWFVSTAEKTVGCGPSFPLKKASKKEKKKSNYQVDPFRGVEVLIFKDDQLPGKKESGVMRLKCQTKTDAAHKSKLCPIYYYYHMKATYLDLTNVAAIPYHIKLTYYDRIHKKMKEVPEGLKFEAYDEAKQGNKKKVSKLDAVTTFHGGVFTIKVPDNPKRTKIRFGFKAVDATDNTKRQWIYSKDKDTDPKIVTKTDAQIAALSFAERYKYYDLPKDWSSSNYWTRYKEGANDKAGRFEKVIKDKLKLKPYTGAKDSKSDNPMTFCLDDIVLIDKEGRQNINDTGNSRPKDKRANDSPVNLSDNSRYTMYYVKDEELVIYNPETDDPYFTDCKFKKNLITDLPTDGQPRMIIFANDFFSVSDQRTQRNGKFKAAKHVLGARAATVNDTANHHGIRVVAQYLDLAARASLTSGNTRVTGTGTKFLSMVSPGDKLHMWVGGAWSATTYTIGSVTSNTRMVLSAAPGASVASTYFKTTPPDNLACADGCGNFELHYIHKGCPIADPSKAGNLNTRSFLLVYWNGRMVKSGAGVTDAEAHTFAKGGCKCCKERWDDKGYTVEPQALDASDANEEGKLQIKPVFHFEAKKTNNGGKHKCKVSITNDSDDGEMGISESKMYKKAWGDPTYAEYNSDVNHTETDIDGKSYKELICAHELGHATGKYDDYAYHGGEMNNSDENYFRQYYSGMPYQWDRMSMMNLTYVPRMKELWHFINRLNSASGKDAELAPLLKKAKYKIVHRFNKSGTDKTFNYYLADSPNDYRDFYKPFKTADTTFTAGRVIPGKDAVQARPAVPQRTIPATATTPERVIPGRPEVLAKPAVPPRTIQGSGICTPALYKGSEDETSRSIKIAGAVPNFAFDGILAVSFKLAFKFSRYRYRTVATPGHPSVIRNRNWPNANAKKNWMNAVKAQIKTLNGRFYLENNGTNTDFRRTYLFFFPICLDLEAAATTAKAANASAPNADFSKAHYTIDVVYNNKAWVPQPTNNNAIEVGSAVNRSWVARYIFGQDAGWSGATTEYKGKDATVAGVNKIVRSIPTTTAIAYQKTDLNYLRDWLRTQLNDNSFTIKGTVA